MPTNLERLPWLIPLAVGLLMAAGWLGIARSEELTDVAAGSARHQMIWSAVALAALVAATVPNYRVVGRISYAAYFAVLGLLLAVYLFAPINGAHRWIRLGGIGFQPSEFAKPAVVLALARYLMYGETCRRFSGLFIPLAIALVPIWLVLREPDLGTSLVFLPVLFAMLLAAGARRRHLAALALIGIAALPALWLQMNHDQRSRVTALWEQKQPDQTPTPAGYHLHQAKQMFALGGFWGTYWSSDADDDPPVAVPEPHTDSIFSVWESAYGAIGCGLLLLCYLALIWRSIAIAEQTREPFGRLVVVGVLTMIATQVVINTGMLIGLLPITGVPLPLVSYGGSGLAANALALGLVVNIAMRPGYEMTGGPTL